MQGVEPVMALVSTALADFHHQGFVPEGCPIIEKKPRRRRSFTPQFKAEIVELCQRGPVGRPGREGLRPDRDRRAGMGQAGRTGHRDPAERGA
jgi:hypothetical protein